MDAMGIAHDTIIQLSDLIDAIEFQLYTPVVEEAAGDGTKGK